jgi:diguanylate cyclase (GGDEF)-like protein/PAS domain S-box-containing protein
MNGRPALEELESMTATLAQAGDNGNRLKAAWRRAINLVPHGRTLGAEDWDRRHRAIIVVLAFYVVGLVAFGKYRGYDWGHLAIDGGAVAAFTVWAAQPLGGRKLRSTLASLGLLTAASMGVHLSGGSIEAHFQFFVVITLLMLYQDWLPFLVAIAYVVGEHGIVGVLLPTAVYNHGAARSNPWLWATIHGAFVLAASAANMAHWRLSEADHERAQATELSYRRLFAGNPQPMWVYDSQTMAFLDVNDAAIAHYGFSREEFLKMTILDIRPPEDSSSILEHVTHSEEMETSGPWRHVTKDGRQILVQISSHRIPFGTTGARHVMAEDVTERESLVNQLRHQAFHDSLTGLPNRALLLDRMSVMVQQARRAGTSVAVLFCDLDGFKPINDSLGHAMGDDLLRQVAQRFAATLRAHDTLARLGGDEFVAVCEVETEHAAILLAERLGEALSTPIELSGHQVRISASIGIALSAGLDVVPDEFLRNADIAMYRAKNRDRGRFEVFDSAMHERAVHRLSLEQDLRPAMGRDEFRLHYQPLVASSDRRLLGFEALVRWEHPTRGLVPPDEFIPIAEDSGFILTLGAWVLGEACRQVAEWSTTSKSDLRVSVNVSARQLADPGLCPYIESTLKATGLKPSALVLEITESVLMANIEASFQRLDEIKKLGVGVSVDDFGTGYSSLSYLSKVPLDYLKIDRSFVASLETDQRARVLASTVVNLARNLGVRSVAEGVETEGQYAILSALGCDLLQGYLLGRPSTPGQIAAEFLPRRLTAA